MYDEPWGWRTEMPSDENAAEREVWATVQALNRAWTEDGEPERLAEYFAPEMIAITPTDHVRREGTRGASCSCGVRAGRVGRGAEASLRVGGEAVVIGEPAARDLLRRGRGPRLPCAGIHPVPGRQGQ